jgi:MFS family permease
MVGSAPGVAPLSVICAATVLPLLAVSAPFALLGEIGAGVGTGLAGQGWVLTAYAAALAAVLIPAGALGDRLGHRRLLRGGLVAFALASAACATATDVAVLVGARTAQGGAAAVVFAEALALLAHAQPRGARGKALAVWGATVGAAFAAGPVVGGALAVLAGWRASFVMLAAAALGVLAASRRLPAPAPMKRPSVDATGTLALVGGVGLLVVAVGRVRTAGPVETTVAFAVALGALALGSRRGALADAQLLRDRGFAAGSAAVFVLGAATFGPLVCVALFMLQAQDASALATGAQLTPLACTAVLASLPAARLASRPRLALPAGLLLCAAGGTAMAAAPATAAWTALAPGMILAGAGTGLINPAATHAALAAAPRSALGIAGAASNVFRQLGLALGLATASAVAQAHVSGTSDDARAAALAAGLDTALLVGAATALTGAVVCFTWLRPARPTRRCPARGHLAVPRSTHPARDAHASAHSQPLTPAHIAGGIENTAGIARFNCDPDG